MNKLEEYKNNFWKEFTQSEESHGIEHDEAFNKGFDTAILLDLPIKFAIWQNSVREEDSGLLELEYRHMGWYTLYKYWIDNIYQIE
jgi:hypothetical protein